MISRGTHSRLPLGTGSDVFLGLLDSYITTCFLSLILKLYGHVLFFCYISYIKKKTHRGHCLSSLPNLRVNTMPCTDSTCEFFLKKNSGGELSNKAGPPRDEHLQTGLPIILVFFEFKSAEGL